MIDYQKVLEEIYQEIKPLCGKGRVADYIPALAQVDPHQFGMALRTIDGREFGVGEYQQGFSIQSISKVFVLTMAMQHTQQELWQRVGREPSGSAFNSLVQLEQENGRPRNPFINAGAIVMTDLLYNFYTSPKEAILSFVRQQSLNNKITINEEVFTSEQQTGHRNYALGHFMKSYNNMQHDVMTVLKTYFYHCSLEMNCIDLIRSMHYLMNGGIGADGIQVLDHSKTRRINALMLTCGPYDDAGEFAYKIGIPTKSGVGGGIVGILPGQFTVAVWSPGLNLAGNSYVGTKALELLTTKIDASIF